MTLSDDLECPLKVVTASGIFTGLIEIQHMAAVKHDECAFAATSAVVLEARELLKDVYSYINLF